MIEPTRCLSSHLTTILLRDFRNEQGAEEHWIFGEERNSHLAIYIGKVITTEIAAAILFVTATVEFIGYTILLLPSILAYPITSKPIETIFPYFSSSGFTIYWNLGNVLTFNPFYTNLYAHESLARISIDFTDRGLMLKIMVVALEVIIILAVIVATSGRNSSIISPLSSVILSVNCSRTQDRDYLQSWILNHCPNLLNRQNDIQPNQNVIDRMRPLVDEGIRVAEGAEFLKKYILDTSQLAEDLRINDSTTKEAINDLDPRSYEFVTTRAIYLFAFEPSLISKSPSFFSEETRDSIDVLRRRSHAPDTINGLKGYVTHLEDFERKPTDPIQLEYFNLLHGIGYSELQGIFVRNCWQLALS